MRFRTLVFSILIPILLAHGTETSISRYARSEYGMLAKEYDMEGGRAYWIDGISILGLPDAGADIMGFSEPAKRLPLGFSGLYAPPPVYERYGLSLNANNGNLIFKENFNPVDTPITKLLWERYGLDGNAFTLNFNRLLLDSVVFSLGLASHSTSKSGYFSYSDVVQQLYTGSLKRDSSNVVLGGRNLAYNTIHFVPAVTWIFPRSSLTAQMSHLYLNNDDATRDLVLKNDIDYSVTFLQAPYNIKGNASFYRVLWNYNFLPNWHLSLSHRLADTDIDGEYTAQTGEASLTHKTFLNPYVKINYEYLRNKDSSLYQDRQLVLLGINDTLWNVAFRGQSGLQRNASAFDSEDLAPALHLGLTLFLPWHLQFSSDYQKDTRFPDMHETHVAREGRITSPNANLKPEKRQRLETNLEYRLSKHFFYAAGYRYEKAENAIKPFWAVPRLKMAESIAADSAFMWFNAAVAENDMLFWRMGFELGNWRFYAEQGKSILRTPMFDVPSRYYKGVIYWSNRFVEDRLKVSCQFDADWFGNRWDYGLKNDSTAVPIPLKKYLSLNFRSTMQIQDFILYMKIENMNHSLMEPEIGYTPPGIRFAYGINWELGD
ncbi:MAG: hypothetical protein FWC15_03800 [Fibromonadales bacterium]|nr:hypothetical protein [Fibromonadales bacterium]